jgi:hypothetical protein
MTEVGFWLNIAALVHYCLFYVDTIPVYHQWRCSDFDFGYSCPHPSPLTVCFLVRNEGKSFMTLKSYLVGLYHVQWLKRPDDCTYER